jgi:DNA-binding beta-propeller fold protein YncE
MIRSPSATRWLVCLAVLSGGIATASCSQAAKVSKPPTEGFVYILSNGPAGVVSKVDLRTNRTLWTIPAGSNGSQIIESNNPRGVFVGNDPTSGTMALLYPNGTMGPTVRVGGSVQGLALTRSGSVLYVLSTSQTGASSIAAVSWRRDVTQWQVSVGVAGFGLALSPDGDRLAVLAQSAPSNPTESSQRLIILATATGGTVSDLPLTVNATGLLFRSDGTLVIGNDQGLATVTSGVDHVGTSVNIKGGVSAATTKPIVEAPGGTLLVAGSTALWQVTQSGSVRYTGSWPARTPPHAMATTGSNTFVALLPRAILTEYRIPAFTSVRITSINGIGEDVVAASW